MNTFKTNVPSYEEANEILIEGNSLNPGPWMQHSLYVGKAAELIAAEDKELDKDVALVLGMLHDIGRRFGVTSMRHALDGYNFLMQKGYELPARICLTHSFSYKHMDAVCGKWDCTDEEYNFVKNYINDIEFTPYDKLIQLCDALALPSGFSLMEKRLVDVALRHGFNDYTLLKWKGFFEAQKYFEERIGKSIYSVLPNIIENTFGIIK